MSPVLTWTLHSWLFEPPPKLLMKSYELIFSNIHSIHIWYIFCSRHWASSNFQNDTSQLKSSCSAEQMTRLRGSNAERVIFEAVFSYDLNYIYIYIPEVGSHQQPLENLNVAKKPSLNHHTKVTLAELVGDFSLLWKKKFLGNQQINGFFPNARQQSLPMSSYGNNVPKCFSKQRRKACRIQMDLVWV